MQLNALIGSIEENGAAMTVSVATLDGRREEAAKLN